MVQQRKLNFAIKHSVILFLQGQIEDSEKEKSELGKELDHIKGENQDLRGNLQQQLKETDQLKVCCRFTLDCVLWTKSKNPDMSF